MTFQKYIYVIKNIDLKEIAKYKYRYKANSFLKEKKIPVLYWLIFLVKVFYYKVNLHSIFYSIIYIYNSQILNTLEKVDLILLVLISSIKLFNNRIYYKTKNQYIKN